MENTTESKKMKKNNKKEIESLREKILKMHDYINSSYYVNMPNMKLGDGESKEVNDVVMMSILTGLLNKNQIFMGNYGLGKTTTGEAVSSLVYGLPYEFVEKGMIQGHPQLTEEKIVGRLDFSKLSETEKVIFSIFAQTPSAKIIDEINRIPEGTQNILLRFVENGQFIYLNEDVKQPKFAFYATANCADGGNTELMPPLLDRFDVSVEVGFPNFLMNYIRSKDCKELRNKISNKELSEKMQETITSKNKEYDKKIEEIKKLSNQFKEQINGMGITEKEKESIKYAVENQEFDKEAELYIDSFFDHINSILKVNGENRANGHNKNYVVGKIQNNASVRTSMRSIPEYSKLLSIIKGEEKVSIDTIQQIMPYTLNHRMEFTDEYKSEVDDFTKNSLQMNTAKQLIQEYTEEDFLKNKEIYKNLYDSIKQGTVNEFLEKHKDSDNPLIKSVYKTFKGQ